MKYKITLQDVGQDITSFITDDNGIVIDSNMQVDSWKGAIIPLSQQKIGDLCMIHHPKMMIEYGYLKYKVTKIENYTNQNKGDDYA